jgi:hypothetical protein
MTIRRAVRIFIVPAFHRGAAIAVTLKMIAIVTSSSTREYPDTREVGVAADGLPLKVVISA